MRLSDGHLDQMIWSEFRIEQYSLYRRTHQDWDLQADQVEETRRTRKTSKENLASEVVEKKPKTGRRVKKPSKEEDPKPVEKKVAAKKKTSKTRAAASLKEEAPKPTRSRAKKAATAESEDPAEEPVPHA